MPKGAPKPTAVSMVSHSFPTLRYLSLSGARTHEAPVPEGEPLGERVEGNVAARALRVVVGRAHLARGGVETAAGGGGREACDGAGEHLYSISAVSPESSGVDSYFEVCCVGAWRGDWQCSARSNGCSCDVDVSWRCWLRGVGRVSLRHQIWRVVSVHTHVSIHENIYIQSGLSNGRIEIRTPMDIFQAFKCSHMCWYSLTSTHMSFKGALSAPSTEKGSRYLS
jgi:hypothetical protein